MNFDVYSVSDEYSNVRLDKWIKIFYSSFRQNEIEIALRKKKIKVNEKNLENHLETKYIPDPDILIRTGNTKRLSNFLLWQLAYSEIFFEKKLWPAFTKKDYIKIIEEYKNIKRNFGRI